MSQIWNLCSCECQCESPVRVIKCILGKLWGLVSTYERSPVSYIGQAHLQAVTPSQSFSNTVIFELKSAIFGWAGDHMPHDWERPARVRVQPAALCRMFPSAFRSVFSVSVEDGKRPKNIYIFFLKCQICTHSCVRSELEGIHSMKRKVSQNQSSDFRAFKVHRRSPVTIEAHTVCNPVLMSQVLFTDTLLICYYFTLLMFI